ncbi:MAG: hypothetical protein WC263_03080 [Candidatus Micrarchaeia archaeon]|jgi:hypothetical protein
MELKTTRARPSMLPARSLPSNPARIFSARWARLHESVQNMREAERIFSTLSRFDYQSEPGAKKPPVYSAKLGRGGRMELEDNRRTASCAHALCGTITPEKAESVAAAYMRTARLVRIATTTLLGVLGAGSLFFCIRLPGTVPAMMGGIMGCADLIAAAAFNIGFPKFDVLERAEWIMGVLEKARGQGAQ